MLTETASIWNNKNPILKIIWLKGFAPSGNISIVISIGMIEAIIEGVPQIIMQNNALGINKNNSFNNIPNPFFISLISDFICAGALLLCFSKIFNNIK